MRAMWAAVAVALLVPGPAGAVFWRERTEAPWCAVYPGAFNDTRWDCFYPTLESCVPFILAGTRGFCNPNPNYKEPTPKRYRHRH